MEAIAAALGDAARWRIVGLLAERPRSVGELSELTGLRQPQTTKHLQTLSRAGLVTVHPLGQRRVYALEPAPLRDLADRLSGLLTAAEQHAGERDVIARYQAAIAAESARADAAGADRWADGRTFTFDRELAAEPGVVWQHWVDADLLAAWWAPPSMTVTEAVLEPRPGGRAVLEYRDADGRYRSEGTVSQAEAPQRLVFALSVLDGGGAVLFTAAYDVRLAPSAAGTRLRVGLTVTATTVDAVPYIAGIETGWGQVLDNLETALTAINEGTNEATNEGN